MSVLLLALLFLGEVGAFVDSAGDARLLSIGVASAALKAGTSLLYQRAMQLSPVSLSVPYLAFTPMLLLVTSYFLLGERPSWRGVLGVVVMTAGAYGLNGARGGDAEKTAAPSGSGPAGKGGKIKAGALPANEKVLEKAKEKASRDHLRGATARAAEDGAGGGGGGAQKQQKPSGGGGLGGCSRRRRARARTSPRSWAATAGASPRGASRAAISSRGSLAFSPRSPVRGSCSSSRRSGA